MEKKWIKGLLYAVFFVIFMVMVIGGQRHIGYAGLCVQMIGLIGLLVLLYLYNKKYT